jgi:hypothetical protein
VGQFIWLYLIQGMSDEREDRNVGGGARCGT